jgi:hypothetical protein
VDLADLKHEAEDNAASDDPIDRLHAAVTVARRVTALGDELVDHYVDAARRAGCSWAQVGEALGVTRQAAQQRQKNLVVRLGQRITKAGAFTRFTPPARGVVVAAQQVARERRHDRVGTEHVLLAIVAEPESRAVRALESMAVRPEVVRATVDARLEPGVTAKRGHLPFDRESKRALEDALRAALALGDDHIGTEHLLVAVAGHGLAGEVLGDLGVTPDRAREAVRALASEE